MEERFIDVKRDCGAIGDGAHDDTKAIQKALDKLRRTGGTVFVPDGVYLITECLIIFSHETLKLAEGATIRRNSDVKYMVAVYTNLLYWGYNGTHDVRIEGGTYDAGENNEVKVTLINTCHARDIVITGCKFVHGAHWHYIEINSTKNALIENCEFDGRSYVVARDTGRSELIQLDTAAIGLYGPVYRNGKLMPFMPNLLTCRNVAIKGCTFWCKGTPAVGMHTNYGHKSIIIEGNRMLGTANIGGTSRGMIIFLSRVKGVKVLNNEFQTDVPQGEKNTCINIGRKSSNTCLAEGNKIIGSFNPCFLGGITERNNTIEK